MCRTRGLVTRCGGVQSPLALRSGKPNLCVHVVGDVDGVYGDSIGAYFPNPNLHIEGEAMQP